MRRVPSVFIAVCLALSLFTGVFAPVPSVRALSEGDFTYSLVGTVPNQTATIIDYTGLGGVVLIPGTIGVGPYPVTSIGAGAFYGCSGLTSVTIPNSATSIGDHAFGGCTGLTSVSIGSGVTSIGDGAFWGCSGLTAAYFLGNAPTVGTAVFTSCAIGFTVRYVSGTTGWTDPWYDYPTDTVYLLTYTSGPHGSISGTLSQLVNYGASGTPVTAVPDANYHFVKWSDNNSTVAARTDTSVTANITTIATFAVNTYALTVNTVGSGTVAKSPDQALYDHGSFVTLTATPASGYTFAGWCGDLTGTTNPATITMTGNKTVTASFTALPTYTLAPSAGTRGTITTSTPPRL